MPPTNKAAVDGGPRLQMQLAPATFAFNLASHAVSLSSATRGS